MNGATRIRVDVPQPYDVVVGAGVTRELPGLLGEDAHRVAVIHPPALARHAGRVEEDLRRQGRQVYDLEVPDAEPAKQVEVAAACWSALGRHGFTRSDAVVGLGGGATTDLAGFVAATWLRGVRVVHVPTTVLGMVDAAVGGKSGINTEHGKNLVGAFHQPAGVLCDLDVLESLPAADVAAGLSEVVKCGFVADPVILDLVESRPRDAVRPGPVLRELVERAVRIKAGVVSADPTERASTVGREVLNYGHTFGHALERVEGYRWRHGEGVSVGLVYAAELARLAGRLDHETAGRHRTVLDLLDLPITYPGGRWAQLREAMSVDKKARGQRLRLVVLDGLARPAILEAPPEDLLTAAYAAVSGRAHAR